MTQRRNPPPPPGTIKPPPPPAPPAIGKQPTVTLLQKITVHVLLDVIADAARGKALDPETCQAVESIAKEYNHTGFTADDVQALYDCGNKPTDASRSVTDAEMQAILKVHTSQFKKAVNLAQYVHCSPHEWPVGTELAEVCQGLIDAAAALHISYPSIEQGHLAEELDKV